MTELQEAKKALEAISMGYKVYGSDDGYISVVNPDFKEDDGSNPYLVLNIHDVELVKK